jgi:hypothetical protein
VKAGFFKFPTTIHLAVLEGADIRGDKVLSESERDEFLKHELIVEEKVDGANLGISFDDDGNIRAQNRGAYLLLLGTGQWKKLGDWLVARTQDLFESLTNRYILFGEWCYAQHSVYYDRLPDWFLGFDIYDKVINRFLSTSRRDELFGRMNTAKIPAIARGRFTLTDLSRLLSQSLLGPQPTEGLYLRIDREQWLYQRAKLVRPAYIQSIEQHWSRHAIRSNRIEQRIPVHDPVRSRGSAPARG